jgi:acetyl esterase
MPREPDMSARQPIDPALRQLLDQQALALAALGSFAAMSDAQRVQVRRNLLQRALESRGAIPGLPNAVATRELTMASGRRARLYRPEGGSRPLPVLVYAHGGGWVAGSIESHDPFCRLLCAASGVMILSIDYRLAPEHRFPAALEDTISAAQWIAAHAQQCNADATRIGLGGDSSGANIAAAAAHRICDSNVNALRALLLLYPVTDHPSHQHRSYEENATGYGLEAPVMRWYWQQYAPRVAADDPDASPLRRASLPALPPTLVATAEYDLLRDEGIAYAQKLQAAGVKVSHLHAPDMHHNYPVHPATVARFPQCDAALAGIAAWLRTVLGAS